MALGPAPLESLSFPARVLLLGAGIVLVRTISLISALLLTGITPLQEAWAGLDAGQRRFVSVAGAGLWIFLPASAVWGLLASRLEAMGLVWRLEMYCGRR